MKETRGELGTLPYRSTCFRVRKYDCIVNGCDRNILVRVIASRHGRCAHPRACCSTDGLRAGHWLEVWRDGGAMLFLCECCASCFLWVNSLANWTNCLGRKRACTSRRVADQGNRTTAHSAYLAPVLEALTGLRAYCLIRIRFTTFPIQSAR